MPFVHTYIYHHYVEPKENALDCLKQKNTYGYDYSDPYLNALLKRVCKQKKKEAPKVPVSLFQTLFVKNLVSHAVSYCLAEPVSSITISDFVPEISYDSFIPGLFRPPSMKA